MFQLERFVDRGAHHLLEFRFSEWTKHSTSEAAAKAFGAGKSDTMDDHTVAIQHGNAPIAQAADYLIRGIALHVVIAKYSDNGHPDVAQRLNEYAYLLRRAVRCQVSAQDEDVGVIFQAGKVLP